MADKKIRAIINGKTISLSEAAFKVAKPFYGAVSEEELKTSKPIELSRPLIKPTMKPIIIKPPMKEVDVMVSVGDPVTEVTVMSVPDISGDPKGTIVEEVKVTADVASDPMGQKEPPAKKAPVKRKKK